MDRKNHNSSVPKPEIPVNPSNSGKGPEIRKEDQINNKGTNPEIPTKPVNPTNRDQTPEINEDPRVRIKTKVKIWAAHALTNVRH
ncbi:hypothetical protein AZI87_10830 [Bdellovibrio bacteriovorus]|uniref:Uncharacterized protein n=1 Tax=Bdellovibrio bacteriovorus TaxID=959 RepID=A0A162G5Z9_BDEBC|nr:hypothetical protein [Bdellovibrio bacteriovorus]KYG65063.1 hypothetical protein AZI87_10830 [Bdellovibrio bacteriovorus]